MNKSFRILSLLATGLAIVGCQDFDNGYSTQDVKKAAYAKNFEKVFGTPDPNQDWSMATLVSANVNLPGITGTAKMNICTGDPRLSSTRLLAQIMLKDGKGSIDFDAIKGSENVFVTVEQDGIYQVYGEYSIVNGLLQLGNAATRSVAGKTEFAATCPTTQGAVAKNVFTGIKTDVKKYHYNGEYYTIEELREWATDHYTSTDVSTYAPFTSSCVISGTYDFTHATINTSKVTSVTENGYVYNGNFYTEAQLRAWANAEAAAGRVSSSNYTTVTPFTNATIVPAGYHFENAIINEEKVKEIKAPCIWKSINGTNYYWNNLEEVINWSKENENLNQSTLGNSQVLNQLVWNSETNEVDYSNAALKPYEWGGPKPLGIGDYIFTNNGNSSWYTYQGLVDFVNINSQWIQNSGPLTNVYFDHESLDFTSATLDNTKVTTVSAGSYIYDGQVFVNESALQNYTETNNLDNNGPYLDCCSGSHLDFTEAVVDLAQAPLENTTTSINLTFLNDVEKVAAEPWAFGWGQKLFGTGGFFQEQVCYFESPKYGTLYGDNEIAAIEEGLVITAKPGEPIELPFIYGATITPDQFGYVYWTDGEDPLTKPHYVLMEDARPNSNIYWDEWQGDKVKAEQTNAVGNMALSVFSTYETQALAHKDDPIDLDKDCHCQKGTGYWSQPYGTGESSVHADWCKSLWDNPEPCNCQYNQEGTGIYSSLGKHLDNCRDPFKEYLAAYNKKVYGSSYRIMYFGDDGENNQGSYVFPNNGKKYHIAFFIAPNNAETNLTTHDGFVQSKYHYSWPELNRRINHLYGADLDGYNASPSYEEGNADPNSPKARGRVKTISWTQDGVVLLGFGDSSGDKDLNDIVFKVSGNFEVEKEKNFEVTTIKWHMNYNHSHDTSDQDLFHTDNLKVEDSYTQPGSEPTFGGHNFLGWSTSPTGSTGYSKTISGTAPSGGKCYYAIWDPAPGVVPDPEPITWILACEDLGGSFDYDFNDVVWSVKTTWNEGTASTKVKVLAAGGTLGFTLKYNSTEICTKADAFTETTTDDQIVNAGGTNGVTRTPNEFTLTTAIETISTEWQKFSVVVMDHGNSEHVVENVKESTKNSKAPQIILLPEEWEWPTELTPINEAYTNFNTWVTNNEAATWDGWRAAKVNGKTVTR